MSQPEPGANNVFDIEQIRRLVELMEQHDLSQIDLRQADQRIQVRHGPQGEMTSFVPAPVAAPHPPVSPPVSSSPPAPTTPAASEAEEAHIVAIKSPMVGTYYSKGNPDAADFVKVGDRVEPDTTVCIVEAMKVFNEIKAEVSGQIVAVLCENEDPVEYGKPMFKVDTSV